MNTHQFNNSPYIIVSIVGVHANESLSSIFIRKQKEIKDTGVSYWLIKSNKAKTKDIQTLGKEAFNKEAEVYCLFIEASSKNGAKPTVIDSVASMVSSDGLNWSPIHKGITVTGKMGKSTNVMVFNEITLFDEPLVIDIWGYSQYGTDLPVTFMLGSSTVCCKKSFKEGMKSRYRNVVGFAKLCQPYSLFVK